MAIESLRRRGGDARSRKMLDKLSDRLKLSWPGARDLPEAEDPEEPPWSGATRCSKRARKVLFAGLSVFAGGRTLEAIEAVCDAEGDLPVDVLDGVESLVDKSLPERGGRAGGEPRFVMLETVHEYAREKLEESGRPRS